MKKNESYLLNCQYLTLQLLFSHIHSPFAQVHSLPKKGVGDIMGCAARQLATLSRLGSQSRQRARKWNYRPWWQPTRKQEEETGRQGRDHESPSLSLPSVPSNTDVSLMVWFMVRGVICLKCWRLWHRWAYRTGPRPRPYVWFLLWRCAAEPASDWTPAGTLSAPDRTAGSPIDRGGGRGGWVSNRWDTKTMTGFCVWFLPGHCGWPGTESWWGLVKTGRRLASSGTDLELLPPHFLLPPLMED